MSDLTRRSFLVLAAGATAGSTASASVAPQAVPQSQPVCVQPTATELSLVEQADFKPQATADIGSICL